MDTFVPLLKFTPSAQNPEVLERITVQREELIASLVEDALDSKAGPSHHLLVGPRGMGKTHILTLVANRLRGSERSDEIVLSWLDEDPWAIRSYGKLLGAILAGIAEQVGDGALAKQAHDLRAGSDGDEDAGQRLLRDAVGERRLVLLAENLDDIFRRIGPNGQARLRAFLEDWRQVTIIASAAQLFEGIQRHSSPFYGFFAVTHLEELSLESATELMRRVAELRGNAEVLRFLGTDAARRRLRAIEAMAGGHPRVWLLLAGCVSVEAIDELVPLFLEALDDLTPYYQSRLKELGEQQQELIVLLSEDGGALSNRALAERSGIPQNQVADILRHLLQANYLRRAEVPAGLAGGDRRLTYWELREPLMRLCLDVKQSRGKPLRMVVEFLRAWYGSSLLDELIRLPDSARLADAYAREAFRGLEGKLSPQELMRGSSDEVLARTEIGLALRPRDRNLHIARTEALFQEGRFADARDFLEPLISTDAPADPSPEEFVLRYQLITARIRLGEADDRSSNADLMALAKQMVELQPNNELAHLASGLALIGLRRYAEALEAFERAIELEPENALAQAGSGAMHEALDRPRQALAAFERAIELEPENPFAQRKRGVVLSRLGRHEEALEAFERAIEVEPEDLFAYLRRGDALNDLGRHEEALEAFERAIELEPGNTWANTGRGVAHQALSQLEAALEAFDQVLATAPQEPYVRRKRAVTLGDLGRYEEALEAFERAIELEPEDPTLHAGRGAVLSELDRLDEAMEEFERASAMNSAEPMFPFVLCAYRLLRGEADAALKSLREALGRADDESLSTTYIDELCLAVWAGFENDPDRASLIAQIVSAHVQAGAADHLGSSLVSSIPTALDDDVSQDAAESWLDEWAAAAADHAELDIPLQLLRAAVAWKGDGDKAHLLALPAEQREILLPLLQPD